LVGDVLGLNRDPPGFSVPATPAARLSVDALLQKQVGSVAQPFIVIAPSALWQTWRPKAAVGRHFLRKGYAVRLTGAGNETMLCKRIAILAPGAIMPAGLTSLRADPRTC
jgi:hypothetical protein